MKLLRKLFTRLSRPTESDIAFVTTIGSVVSIQLAFASKSLQDASRDPGVAGYFFGASMSFLEHQGVDTTNRDTCYGMLGMAAAELFREQKEAIDFLAFVGQVTGHALSNQGIAAAIADIEAFTARKLAPFTLAEQCMGEQAWSAYRSAIGAG